MHPTGIPTGQGELSTWLVHGWIGDAYTFPNTTSEPGLSSTVPRPGGEAGVAAVMVSTLLLRPARVPGYWATYVNVSREPT